MNPTRPFPTSGMPKFWRQAVVLLVASTMVLPAWSATALADQPLFTSTGVPGNLALPLSVEYPTAVSVAHIGGTYSTTTNLAYLGYFDPNKCYEYVRVSTPTATDVSHFKPVGAATNRACSGKWSGNFLNWATMQTIDPFRSALTGGYRIVDTKDTTIIEKAVASGQGGEQNFPNRTISGALVAGATPWPAAAQVRMRIQGLGTKMRFSIEGSADNNPFSGNNAGGEWDGSTNVADANNKSKTYEVSVRVKVCDPSVGVESNCKKYPAGNYKPEGLIQKYADRIRFSAFGYLNHADLNRDGGVMRARQKFVGPEVIVPGKANTANAAREWDPDTGIFVLNPDAADASATATLFGVPVTNSGVINYLNKFGHTGTYKMYDPVGELYYTALRYFKNLGNVAAYTTPGTADATARAVLADGFPVITKWDDPIQHTCQKNFILGIGDVNTHADKNLPGATSTASEPAKPAEVANDKTVDSVAATNKVGQLEGLGNTLANVLNYGGCCSNNAALMAGLAYDANTQDIRPDLPNPSGMPRGQSVKTYWLDVLEFQNYKANNQFYLAAKYGGFRVPDDYDTYGNKTALPESWWRQNTETVGNQPRPDNYFVASRPDQVISGLTAAFADIASQLKAFTTSFSTALPQVSSSGNASYSTQFSAKDWTGEMTASEITFAADTGAPSLVTKWTLTSKLKTQFAGANWSSDTAMATGRRVVTWDDAAKKAVPFRIGSLNASQKAALNTPYVTGDDSADYLNYLRGDRSLEQSSSTTSATVKPYRERVQLLGDIVGSKATPVGPPSLPLSDAANPGYSAFRKKWDGTTDPTKKRPTIVYVGANDGMLHAIKGSTTDADGGTELFAYVPSATFQGPTGNPGVDGLAGLGNPSFSHHFYVNATPTEYSIDFDNTSGAKTGTPDWRSVLIGGLGKGGRSYYAIDVTDPAAMTSESAVASKVLWEFTDPDLGFTYGDPSVIKTRKYGWVVIIPSGYNNQDGKGYFFIVHPRTGALLEKISTGEGSTASDAGLAHANTFVWDRTDGTADAVYAGDLQGNLWRWDISATTGTYPAPVKIAQLKDASGSVQPVTSRPMIEVQPGKNKRFVLVGTGRLLHTSDLLSSQVQAFYAIADGTGTRFNTSTELPAGVRFPLERSNLVANTDVVSGVTAAPATSMGWYVDLGTSNNVGWRVIGNPTSFFGVVGWAAVIPNGDVCEPSGRSRVYGVDFGTGKSVLTAGAYQEVAGMVTDLRFLSVEGKPRLIAGSDQGTVTSVQGSFGIATGMRRLNWRELPVVD
jgi:type IV pilus assembly protein PilY1